MVSVAEVFLLSCNYNSSIFCVLQVDSVRFRELTHEQVFGSMHEQMMRM